MRGVSLKAVQELLGHATIGMTVRYAHLSPDVKRDAVQLLHASGPLTPTLSRRERETDAPGAHGRCGIEKAPTNRGLGWSGKRDLNSYDG